jgi:hypothetical protein
MCTLFADYTARDVHPANQVRNNPSFRTKKKSDLKIGFKKSQTSKQRLRVQKINFQLFTVMC